MVFVDAENISKTLFKQFYINHKEETYKVYAKKSVLSGIYLRLKNVEFIDCCIGKNSADTFMTAGIVKSLYEDNCFQYYVITQDKDLAIAVKMITDHQKKVTLVTSLGKKLSNLKSVGVDLSYLSVEEYDTKENNVFLTKISRTKNNGNLYDLCPRRVWVKRLNGGILEVPFYDGMPLGWFKKFLEPHKKSIGVCANVSWYDYLKRQYLKLEDNKVFFMTEDELNATA